jgi:hypothetical protein
VTVTKTNAFIFEWSRDSPRSVESELSRRAEKAWAERWTMKIRLRQLSNHFGRVSPVSTFELGHAREAIDSIRERRRLQVYIGLGALLIIILIVLLLT